MIRLFPILSAVILGLLLGACTGKTDDTPRIRASGRWDMGVGYSGSR